MNRRIKMTAVALTAAVTVSAWGACVDVKSTQKPWAKSTWAVLFGWAGFPVTATYGENSPWITTEVATKAGWAGLGQAIAPSQNGWAGNNAGLDSSEEFLLLKDQYPWLTRSILRAVRREAAGNRMPVLLVLAVIDAESTGRTRARGPAVQVRLSNGKRVWTRARGLMQLIPEFHGTRKGKAGKSKGRWNLYHAETNIKLGTAYLALCLRWAGGDWTTGLKNYNSGPRSKYYNWSYIKKILANYERTRRSLRPDRPAGLKPGRAATVAAVKG